MVNLINFQKDGFDDVVTDELKVWVPKVVHDILLAASEEVVNNNDLRRKKAQAERQEPSVPRKEAAMVQSTSVATKPT